MCCHSEWLVFSPCWLSLESSLKIRISAINFFPARFMEVTGSEHEKVQRMAWCLNCLLVTPLMREGFLSEGYRDGWSHHWTDKMISFLVACTHSLMAEDSISSPAPQGHIRVYLGTEWDGLCKSKIEDFPLLPGGWEGDGFVWIIPWTSKRLKLDIQGLHLVLWWRGFFG